MMKWMNVQLQPEDQRLVEKRLESGVFTSVQDVIHRALETLDAEEEWLQANKAAIQEKIERGLTELERGEGLTPEESLAQLEAKKEAWRDQQRRA